MSFKFVTLYGVVVVLTSLFFQFVPLPKMLSWEEMLLSKLLNQAPALLCIAYLWFQRSRIKKADIFYLLMAFLFFNIFSEIYYYFVSPEELLRINVLNNSIIYWILITLFMRQRVQLREQVVNAKNIRYVVLVVLFFLTGFGFSIVKIYQEYFSSDKPLFFAILLSMLSTTIAVSVSFFVDKTFSRNWYKIVFGTIAIALLDIYVYLSLFVLVAYPAFIYTIGKIFFSVGLILIMDRTMRKCLIKIPVKIYYKSVSNTV
jgi:hypothetical protein